MLRQGYRLENQFSFSESCLAGEEEDFVRAAGGNIAHSPVVHGIWLSSAAVGGVGKEHQDDARRQAR